MGEGLTIKLPCGCVAKDASLLCPLHGQQKIDGIGPIEMRVENTPGPIDINQGTHWGNMFPDVDKREKYNIRASSPDDPPIDFRDDKGRAAEAKLTELGYGWDGKEWVKG